MNYIPVIQLKQEIVQEVPIKIDDITMSSTSVAADFAREFIGGSDREVVIVIGLSTKSKINFISTIAIGSLNAATVTPRETFKCAIISNCARIIIAHNHPSYDTTPSQSDIQFTKRIEEAGDLVGIELLDHIIVSPTNYFSFRADGYLGNGGD
ncbi:JAB domain-containing protein [Jeotgalibaca sp. MA1X17-3]|uniref:JAB domain-containing protein n=1 Tax=Jeotgalibaca sp. MA1X17-3 TaxID=2908211 RepID=UPI001F32216B|nr:JAB domain-containing protein [Jeotgalibaca sp. MA1X17-3]UJF15961.1 JAB domain-containing protein [Jeotgalibaca sp. MA1X17-3]